MKFQWTKHKKLWDKLANTNEIQKCYEELLRSGEEFDSFDVLADAKDNLIENPYLHSNCYACEYVGVDEWDKPNCDKCPLFSPPCYESGPYKDLLTAIDNKDCK